MFSCCSNNSALAKYEYNSSLYMPLGKTQLTLVRLFSLIFKSFLFDEARNFGFSLGNKNLGSPSFFFSLYIIILEQIPIKFLNKTTSFISLLILAFFSLSESIIGIGGTSTLLNPTFISQLIKDFFLFKLNLIKTQFISFSTNLIKGSFILGIVI